MVQETSISGQVSKIISEKGTELLRISSIPENLWPEAIQHAVWLKNRTPARALRKKDVKTPYHALKGFKPTLTRERIWGSRAYVTYPPELRNTAEMTKLHSPRGWLGYFVGCESEAMYHIYSPEKHRVYRIGVARVEDGEGLDDPHDAPCLEDRIPTMDVEIMECLSSESENGTSGDEDSNRDDDYDHHSTREDAVNSPPSGMGPLLNPRQEEPEADAIHQSNSVLEDADDEDEDYDEHRLTAVKSKYFEQDGHAGMAKRKFTDETAKTLERRDRAAPAHSSSSEESDTTDDSWYFSDDGTVSWASWDFVAKYGQPGLKNYLPNDSKCDRCFRFARICDADQEGYPCSMCAKLQNACGPQSKNTKNLVLPENRNRKAEIRGSLQDPPCRKCFQVVHRCYLNGPAGSKCERCARLDVVCNWNLDGAKKSAARQRRQEASKQNRHDKHGFTPVSWDKKCYRCATRRIACDGGSPCSRCNTTRLRSSCRPQGVETLPPCFRCRSCGGGKECDRGRPCKRCMSQKRNCTYDEQDGLLSRTYRVPGGPVPEGCRRAGPLLEGQSSDEECVRCQREKLNCDREQPCYPCVSTQKSHRMTHCHYRRSNGTYESWALRPFEVDAAGQPILRADYESHTGRKRRNATQELRDATRTMPERRRHGKKSSGHSAADAFVDVDDDQSEPDAGDRTPQDGPKRVKFGLSAYRDRVPPFELNLRDTGNAKYQESKKEELRAHAEKGTWKVVPLPEGIKPVTSRWVNTDKYGPDGIIAKQKSRLVAMYMLHTTQASTAV